MRQPLKGLFASILSCLLALPAFGQSAGPQDAERSANREQVWRIPAAGGSPLMLSTVMRPKGEARAPLVVINHGSPAESSAHGYVVAVPLRRGYGETGGAWAEDYGPCNNPDYAGAGLQTAADIRAAIDFMRTQPFVAPDHTIVVGQSAGGWGTIALSSLNPPGVSGMIDFAGGRGGHQRMPTGGMGNCATSALVQAAAKYGATARVPMLWIYAANDTFFEPGLARRMVDAYNGAGGHATLQAVGPNGQEGHNLATSPDGPAVWSPLVEAFLRTLR